MPGSDEKIAAYSLKVARESALLREIREESEKHRNKHKCDVYPSDPLTGRLLDILIRTSKAKRVLEVGCGLGYSAVWLARALPRGGSVDTIERDLIHAKIARKNFEMAGVENRVRILQGEASQVLSKLRGPFDFIFEDATCGKRPEHYEDLVRVLRKGGYIQFANWFPMEPAIVGGASLRKWKKEFGPSASAPAKTRRFVEEVLIDRRLSALLLPHLWLGMATKIRD